MHVYRNENSVADYDSYKAYAKLAAFMADPANRPKLKKHYNDYADTIRYSGPPDYETDIKNPYDDKPEDDSVSIHVEDDAEQAKENLRNRDSCFSNNPLLYELKKSFF